MADAGDDFELLEALRHDAESGFTLLDAHLARLAASAAHFSFACDIAHVRDALDEAVSALDGIHKVRVRLSRGGECIVETEAIAMQHGVVSLALARSPVDSNDEFLRHKTSRRAPYEQALDERGDADDVLLWNEREEVTEASSSNVVARLDGRLITPPVAAGILPGTFRALLLDRGEILEAPLRRSDLGRCEALYLINSVRGWRTAVCK